MRKEFLLIFFGGGLFTILLFHKFFLFGLLPMPADALVKAYYPWKYGGWSGYDPFSSYKEVIATDVFRQQLPWIKLTVEQIKKGQWPLWNPYNFSGYPLLANLQSHVFYPLNIVFFVLPLIPAWVVFVMIQPFLSCLLMYLYLRSIRLKKVVALFGGMAFMFSSFMITWLEWGFIAQGAMYLPLFLWLIEMVMMGKRKLLLVLPLLIYTVITSGYVQVVAYVLILSVTYFVFRLMTMVKDTKERLVLLSHTAAVTVVGVLLTAVQLLPTIEVYRQSTRQIGIEDFFKRYLLPWQSFITIFAHDFFGNFATRNLWTSQYGEFMMFFGAAAAFFAVAAIVVAWQKNLLVKFFALLAFFSLLFALPSPFSYLILMMRLPILSSGIPSRTLFIFQFSMIILSAFGLEVVLKRKPASWTKIKKLIVSFSLIYVFLWLLTFFIRQVFHGGAMEQSIARRNLVLPSGIFLAVSSVLILFFKQKRFAVNWLVLSIFALALIEYLYFSNKFLPFAKREYIFPAHPVIQYLKKETDYYRAGYFSQGRHDRYLDNNFSTYFNLFSPEGFDSLHIRRYAELVTAAKTGKFELLTMRSDVLIPKTNDFRTQQKLLNLLGLKYLPWVVEHVSHAKWPDIHKFPEDRFELVWFQDRFQIYRNKQVLPRAFMVGDYAVIKNDGEILSLLYNKDFDLSSQVILEEELPAPLVDRAVDSQAEIINYQPNRVEIGVKTPTNQILFLSDSYFPGWQAYIDGRPTKIYRANYAFRAVFVPKDSQKVIFKYEPQSFQAGLTISLFAFAFYLLYLIKLFIIKTR